MPVSDEFMTILRFVLSVTNASLLTVICYRCREQLALWSSERQG